MKVIGIFIFLSGALLANNISEKIKECKSGDYHACNFVGDDYLFNEDYTNSNIYYFKAKELMEESCKLNDYEACYNLGFNYEMGTIVYPKNNKKAISYYKKSIEHNIILCNRGDADSCFNLGLDYSDEGIMKDMNKSVKYFTMACSKGKEIACEKLTQ